MTLPVYLADQLTPPLTQLQVGFSCEVSGDQAHHAVASRRLRVGEELDLVDGNGLRVRLVATAVAKRRFTGEVIAITTDPKPAPILVLVQALAKHKRDIQAVESACELGVDHIYPWQATRSVVTWKGGDTKANRWDSARISACEQSRRTHWASLHGLRDTTKLCEDIEQACSRGEIVFVAHETDNHPLPQVLQDNCDAPAYWVIVGPEGGITDTELTQLLAAGAKPIRLGPTVMRASTAGPVALAVIAAATKRWQMGHNDE